MANLENVGRRSTQRITYPEISLVPLAVIAVSLLLWELLSRLGQISPLFFPPPSMIGLTLWQLAVSGKLWPHVLATIERLGVGFCLGGSFGLILGLGMGWSPRLRMIVDPLVAVLHPIPKIAIFPLIMIIFGIGEASKIVAIAIAAFFPMLINSMAGVRGLNPVYFEVARNYRASRWKTFSRVVLPGSLPMVLTGVRLAVNMAMVISVAVELLAAKEGLGVIIWFSWQTLRVADMYASLIVIAMLGFGANLLLHWLTKRLTPWRTERSGGDF